MTTTTTHIQLRRALVLLAAVAACKVGGDSPGGGGAGGVDAGGGGGQQADCSSYCSVMTQVCTGANAQYADAAACMTWCQQIGGFAAGAATDTDVNTIACRLYHAGAAESDPAAHCAHAGPSGGGACGSYCDNYCAVMGNVCTGGDAQYAGTAECLTYCEQVGAFAAGAASDTDVNTVSCRLFHAGAAASDATHCAHAGPTGGGACGSWCDNYCDLAMTHCTGGDALYASAAACQTACAAFPTTGAIGDADGDTVQCRLFHLGAAASDATHCAHGAADGGGVCVAP